MKIIALYNIKGGVGKTAAAVNLSYLSAQYGYTTLLWDLDPQGAASFYYRVKPKLKGGIRKLLKETNDLQPYIKATDYPLLDLIPADFSMRNFDLLLNEEKKPSKHLRKLIHALDGQYDYVFLDCSPSISLISECVFLASDALLIPTIPTTLSLRTLEQLLAYFRKHDLSIENLMPFFSMVDVRRNIHKSITHMSQNGLCRFLDTEIPYMSEVEKMGLERKPVCTRPSSKASMAFHALWCEVLERLDSNDNNTR